MDKRVEKTRAALKQALIDCVKTNDFDQVNVANLCKDAKINRVTFYTHYHDKYELLEDIFHDMDSKAIERSRELDKINNKNQDKHQSFVNYLQSFVEGLQGYDSLVYSMSNNQSGYIYFAYKSFLNQKLQNLLLYYNQEKLLCFPLEQITAFISNGLIGFVIEGITKKASSYTDVFLDAQKLFHKLIDNQIFIIKQ